MILDANSIQVRSYNSVHVNVVIVIVIVNLAHFYACTLGMWFLGVSISLKLEVFMAPNQIVVGGNVVLGKWVHLLSLYIKGLVTKKLMSLVKA